jgi:transposase
MRYIKNLTEIEKQTLEAGHRQGKSYQYRNRCQAILLSNQGYSVQQLASLFKVKALSIYKWLNRYESKGMDGLQNQKGKGRKPLLKIENQIHRQVVESQIEQDGQRLKVAKWEMEKQLNTRFSESTLKRFLKKVVMSGNGTENG